MKSAENASHSCTAHFLDLQYPVTVLKAAVWMFEETETYKEVSIVYTLLSSMLPDNPIAGYF